jgi:hypothetical protein
MSDFKSADSAVGEWTKRSEESVRMIVMRVGNGIFSPGGPKRITSPSTSHTLSATLFGVSSGG